MSILNLDKQVCNRYCCFTAIGDDLELENILNQTYSASLIANWDFYENFSMAENRTGSVLDLKEALENPASYKCKHYTCAMTV